MIKRHCCHARFEAYTNCFKVSVEKNGRYTQRIIPYKSIAYVIRDSSKDDDYDIINIVLNGSDAALLFPYACEGESAEQFRIIMDALNQHTF